MLKVALSGNFDFGDYFADWDDGVANWTDCSAFEGLGWAGNSKCL